jgi:hypothetical protein
MHPSLIGALARQRQAELLRPQQFRDSRADRTASAADGARGPIRSVRYSLGTALVVAGTRLMARRETMAELAVQTPDARHR